MATTATDQDHIDALLANINASLATLGDDYQAFEADELKKLDNAGQKPDDYVELTLTRRFGGVARGSARNGSGGWRATTRFVSKNYLSNARNLRTAVRDGLEFTRLTVAGGTTTPVMFESEDDVAPDDGWYSGLTTWSYAKTATPPH